MFLDVVGGLQKASLRKWQTLASVSEARSVTAIEGLDSSSARENTGRVLSRAQKSSVQSLALEEDEQETIKKKVTSFPPGHLA